MNASSRANQAIRQRIADEQNETVTVSRAYLSSLYSQIAAYEKAAENYKQQAESTQEDLRRAQALIDRLRAENKALKAYRQKVAETVDVARRHISIAGNVQKKWAISFVKSQLAKARLI